MSGVDSPGAAGAAGAGTQVPPFGGDNVLGQLNEWAAKVDQKIEVLQRGVEEVRGGAMVFSTQLQGDIQNLEAKVMANLQQVADVGVAALTKTIDDFKIELGKHEYYHNQARSGIEQVVAQATVKFQEVERAMLNRQKLTRDAEQQLRAQLQAE